MIKGKITNYEAGLSLLGNPVLKVNVRPEGVTSIKEVENELKLGQNVTIIGGDSVLLSSPYSLIKDVYVNEKKRTVAVKFKDDKVVTKKCCEGDAFDVYAGVALCLAVYLSKSTKDFHKLVDRKTRTIIK